MCNWWSVSSVRRPAARAERSARAICNAQSISGSFRSCGRSAESSTSDSETSAQSSWRDPGASIDRDHVRGPVEGVHYHRSRGEAAQRAIIRVVRAGIASEANTDVEGARARVARADAQPDSGAPGEVAGAEDRAVDAVVTVVLGWSDVHRATKVGDAGGRVAVRADPPSERGYLGPKIERVHLMLPDSVRDVRITHVPAIVVLRDIDVARDVSVGQKSALEAQ